MAGVCPRDALPLVSAGEIPYSNQKSTKSNDHRPHTDGQFMLGGIYVPPHEVNIGLGGKLRLDQFGLFFGQHFVLGFGHPCGDQPLDECYGAHAWIISIVRQRVKKTQDTPSFLPGRGNALGPNAIGSRMGYGPRDKRIWEHDHETGYITGYKFGCVRNLFMNNRLIRLSFLFNV